MTVLNFPKDPTLGQTYIMNGVEYTWDSQKWTASPTDGGDFVERSGDNMFGDLTLATDKIVLATDGNITAAGTLRINNAAGEPQAYMVNDGSISIAWNLLSSGLCTYISGVSGKHFIGFNGSADSGTIQLDPSDGSITAAGNIELGGFDDGDKSKPGTKIYNGGGIGLRNVTKDPSAASIIIQGGTGTAGQEEVIKLNTDGSITAAGTIYGGTAGASGTDIGLVAFADSTESDGAQFGAIYAQNSKSGGRNFVGANYSNGTVITTEIFEDGRITAAGDVKIGGTLPSAPNITLGADGNISNNGSTLYPNGSGDFSNGSIRINGLGSLLVGTTSYSESDANIALEDDGSITAAGNITSQVGSQFAVVSYAGITQSKSDGTTAVQLKPDGSITAAGRLNTDRGLAIKVDISSDSGCNVIQDPVSNAYSYLGRNNGSIEIGGSINPVPGSSNPNIRLNSLDGSATFAGPVKIGGTADANEISEYEEGTWTPTIDSWFSNKSNQGKYTKIGNVVNVCAKMVVECIDYDPANASVTFNLPFPADNGNGGGFPLTIQQGGPEFGATTGSSNSNKIYMSLKATGITTPYPYISCGLVSSQYYPTGTDVTILFNFSYTTTE